ncbi:MAG: PspC domain-containing protein [Planctomycetes bacterium]|nr:PspC domain-containing protein [Planctomycetota bacterium]MBI3845099.1 PspC domain-containing protein [Planctomycetota bacterium]
MHIGWFELVVLIVLALIATGSIGARRSQAAGGRQVSPKRPDGSRVLCRIPQHGAIGGVCAGVAYFFSWPVWVARFLFAIGVFAGGAGGFIYVLLWIFMPPADALPEDFDARTS